MGVNIFGRILGYQ